MNVLRTVGQLIRLKQLPASPRRLLVYSEGRNYWTHLRGLVNEIAGTPGVQLVYVSSDEADPGLAVAAPDYHPILTDFGWARNWLFENLEAAVVAMTMPDLHRYQVKRSRFPAHYVYLPHSLISLHMAYRPGAFDHFDSVFCAGPHHERELRALEAAGGLPAKSVVRAGYSRLDALAVAAARGRLPPGPPRILVAPSWGPDGLLETRGVELVDLLVASGYHVTLRPHPQTLRFAEPLIRRIVAAHAASPGFIFEGRVDGHQSLDRSALMISDWSGAAIEFAFAYRRPVLFVDVPRKINNPAYASLGIEPIEVALREQLGSVISPSALHESPRAIDALLARPINGDLAPAHVFNLGQADRVGAAAILDRLKAAERSVD